MRIITTLILVSSFVFAKGQDSSQIDFNSFLIGTLSDYMGRATYKEVSDRVDTYFPYEKCLANYMDSIFTDSIPDLELRLNENRPEIYSKTLSDLINKYYEYEPSGPMTMEHDTIYRGKLKSELFLKDKEILSFIAGTYVRFGEPNDSTTCIRIHNSYSKAKICVEYLKKMNCKNVKYEIMEGYIPTSHIVYFDPTPELSSYLEKIMKLRKQLNTAWEKQIKEMIGEDNYKKFVRQQ